MKTYTPRGKAKTLLDAMHGDPDKVVWTVPEVASVLKVGIHEVMAYVLYPLKNQALYRGRRNGLVIFSLQPFPEGEALANKNTRAASSRPKVQWEPGDDIRIPRVVPNWRPPVMVAPRAGSGRC